MKDRWVDHAPLRTEVIAASEAVGVCGLLVRGGWAISDACTLVALVGAPTWLLYLALVRSQVLSRWLGAVVLACAVALSTVAALGASMTAGSVVAGWIVGPMLVLATVVAETTELHVQRGAVE